MNAYAKKISLTISALIVFLCVNGFAYASSTPELVRNLNNIASIQAGVDYILVLKADGEIVSIGKNDYGQLANGTNASRNEFNMVKGVTNCVKIDAGYYHNLAITAYGDVYSWGKNDKGQLGIGNNKNSNVPVKVNDIFAVASVATGSNHSLALKADGSVWTWGDNTFGQLGDGTNLARKSPVEIKNLYNIIAIAAGSNHSMALQADGTIWVWGDNSFGQLGIGSKKSEKSPVAIDNFYNNVTVEAGDNFSLALKADGDVYTWGDNTYGQLGDGTNITRTSPVKVNNLPAISNNGIQTNMYGRQVRMFQNGISAGNFHVIVLSTMGDVYTWGRNNFGQLGNSSNVNSNTPILVSGMPLAAAISSGIDRTFAISTYTDVYQWGKDMVQGTQVNIPTKAPQKTNYVNIKVNGVKLNLTVQPRIIDNKTMVPIRDIVEGIGGTILWDGGDNKITAKKGNNTVILKADSDKANVSGTEIKMEAPVRLIESRSFAQVRTIAEGLGAKVDWDGATLTVNIITN